MDKKRILWVSEASFMNTGFSVLTYEILSRLYQINKLELFELGSYSRTSDPRASQLPWKFYGAIPEQNNEYAVNRYNNSQYGQFGEAVYEQVLLDCTPDVVIDVRDFWMCNEWQTKSPFHDYYKYALNIVCDGKPQKPEWLADYANADLVLSYSRFGKQILEQESGGKIKIFDISAPGVNHTQYIPKNKVECRRKLGIPENANVILTTMRNQKRKLFPDLFDAFLEYINLCIKNGRDDIASNTYLYCQTSGYDVGFDLGKHIERTGLGNRVLFNYICNRCKRTYVLPFSQELTHCKYCGSHEAHMPNTQHGLTREQLVDTYNCADLYVQYSICEGFGMGIAEAKSCCVPAMAVDYSAMSEQVECQGCQKINVQRFFYESVLETEQSRALPDNTDFARKVYKFFTTDKSVREAYGKIARKDVVENYSFDRCAKIFERAIDSLEIFDRNKTWFNPKPQFAPATSQIPDIRDNSDFIDWCLINILSKPELTTSYWKFELLKGLNTGFDVKNRGSGPVTRESVAQNMLNMANNKNMWEKIRIQKFFGKAKTGPSFEEI